MQPHGAVSGRLSEQCVLTVGDSQRELVAPFVAFDLVLEVENIRLDGDDLLVVILVL